MYFHIFYISAFKSLTNRPTFKIFIEKMFIGKRNLHKKNFFSISGRENRVSHKPDRRTYRHMDRRKYRQTVKWTDIGSFRVVSLLKKDQ